MRFPSLLLSLFLCLGARSAALALPSAAQASPAPAGASSAKPPAIYAQFVKDAKRQPGLVDVLQKDDEFYLDIGEEQIGRSYILAPVLAGGAGGDAFAGRMYPSLVLTFKRVGNRLLWMSPNTHYTATPDTESALDISVADSVLLSTPIVAEDTEHGRIVVGMSFFLSDFENIGREISDGRGIFGLDPSRSYIERVKALPKNVEILADLTMSGPPGSLETVPDARGVLLKMHYSLLELPHSTGYVPRLADDRVGYFITAQKRMGDDDRPSSFVRYVNRWNLRNGPITYYLTKEIPPRYRPVIKRALLEWNTAFEKLGYPHAIDVKDQPDDPAWDPDDVRYSTVRWIVGDSAPFAAYAPSIVNPLTGEIIRAEIVADGEALRVVKRGYANVVAPLLSHGVASVSRAAPPSCAAFDCEFMQASAESASLGSLALQEQGATEARREQYAEDWLRSIILHEAGHTLGLRHNFEGSTIYSMSELHDSAFTATHGLVSSVMEYTPVNLSPKGKPQGEYFQLQLGPYDAWAIRYGYEYFPNVKEPEDEVSRLRAIAAESTMSSHAYGTDEDSQGPDPRISAFDLSDDPLAFDANQFTIADELVRDLDRWYPRKDESYFEERQAFLGIMRTYVRAADLASKYIGGVYTSRAHRGQAGGGPPLRAIAREEERRAFDLIADRVFSRRAFVYPPQLLNDLGSDRYTHWSAWPPQQPDFPITAYVAAIQGEVLEHLFNPQTMTRISDEQLKVGHTGDTMSLGDLFAWTQGAIWDDFSSGSQLHRNLQSRWTDVLIALTLAPEGLLRGLGYPPQSSALARGALLDLEPKMRVTLARPLDREARAHLIDQLHRIDSALTARAIQS